MKKNAVNILDENIGEAPFTSRSKWMILFISLAIPFLLSAIIYYYFFRWNLEFQTLQLDFLEWGFVLNEISLVSIFYILFAIFIFPVSWEKYGQKHKTFYRNSQIFVGLFSIFALTLALWGKVSYLPEGGWTAYPPLSALPQSEDYLPSFWTYLSEELKEFKVVLFLTTLAGVLSFIYLTIQKRKN